MQQTASPQRVAVIGSGISGLSAAWLLNRAHDVTIYEAAPRIGGHSHTVEADLAGKTIAVDTGFIVYNEPAYPNLTALLAELRVATQPTEMSFAVSLDGGRLEYSGGTLLGLCSQPSNLLRPRFWSMIGEVLRFYRQAPADLDGLGDMPLAAYLDREHFGQAMRHHHLYPMAAAIWSTPSAAIKDYPAAAFIRFCQNHGLLQVTGRPLWRTVRGGSRQYVARLTQGFSRNILTGTAVKAVRRDDFGVSVYDVRGGERRFDHVVIATHANTALAMLADPSGEERRLLGAFNYTANEAVLHSDASLMPKRRAAWSSWNYLAQGNGQDQRLSVTYWMNQLQGLNGVPPVFVTLNPMREPRAGAVLSREVFMHPMFTSATERAQKQLWSLQGVRRTWFCGAHFGAGFHEDGLQSGLAVAEDLGGVKRPWTIANDSARIYRTAPAMARPAIELAS